MTLSPTQIPAGPEARAAAACLDRLVQEGRAFACWREPGGPLRFACQRDGACQTPASLREARGSGFVLAPFACSDREPLVFIQEEISAEGPGPLLDALQALAPQAARSQSASGASSGACSGADSGADAGALPEAWLNQPPSPDYRQAFARFHERLREGAFHKLVLARSQRVPARLSPGTAFLRACALYPEAMASLSCTGPSGVWFGATPEILLAGAGGRWRTMALAGTKKADDPAPWDEKNIEEQGIVARYIQERLAPFCRDLAAEGPRSSQAGAVQHLRTDFAFTLAAGASPAEVAEALHPTPAVCGVPKEEASRFIQASEGCRRRYYAGFLGPWSGSRGALYVNLRCMELAQDSVALYAGGGLLASSSLEKEWQETCQKMKTALSAACGRLEG